MRKTKQALVILTPGFPADENDGNCLPAQQIFVRLLAAAYPDLRVIVISFQYPFIAKHYVWFGSEVFALGGSNRGRVFRLLIWLKAFRLLNSLRKENDIFGILSFWCGETAMVGSFFSRYRKLPHLIWILGQDAKKTNKYARWIKPGATELVSMSGFLTKQWELNFGIRPAYLVPNGIDRQMFPATSVQDRDIDIFGAGSLIPLKQYNIFVRIVKRLTKTYPHLRVCLCGSGPESASLQAQIDALDLATQMSLLGEIPHQELLRLMGRARIFLHTSEYEGFSTVCLEALAAGAHVISFVGPMLGLIAQWHIAQDEEEMLGIAMDLLMQQLPSRAIVPFEMAESVRKMATLFEVQR